MRCKTGQDGTKQNRTRQCKTQNKDGARQDTRLGKMREDRTGRDERRQGMRQAKTEPTTQQADSDILPTAQNYLWDETTRQGMTRQDGTRRKIRQDKTQEKTGQEE